MLYRLQGRIATTWVTKRTKTSLAALHLIRWIIDCMESAMTRWQDWKAGKAS